MKVIIGTSVWLSEVKKHFNTTVIDEVKKVLPDEVQVEYLDGRAYFYTTLIHRVGDGAWYMEESTDVVPMRLIDEYVLPRTGDEPIRKFAMDTFSQDVSIIIWN